MMDAEVPMVNTQNHRDSSKRVRVLSGWQAPAQQVGALVILCQKTSRTGARRQESKNIYVERRTTAP